MRREHINNFKDLIIDAPLDSNTLLTNLVDGTQATILHQNTSASYNSTYGGVYIYPTSYCSSSGANYKTSGMYWTIPAYTITESCVTMLFEVYNVTIIDYSDNDIGSGITGIYSDNSASAFSNPIFASNFSEAAYKNVWMKMAYVRNTTNTYTYKDGVLKYTQTGTYSINSSKPIKLTLGAQYDGRENYHQRAAYRNVKIFKTALTLDEIKQYQNIS